MKIGHVSKKSYKAGEETKSYLEMIIRPPMMESGTFTVQPNKEKSKPTEPDFNIWYNFNRKGERYPSTKVGALWNKVSSNGTDYKDGSIECPAVAGGKMYIAVFATKVEEGETKDWSHDVLWSPPRVSQDSGYSDGGYAAPYTPPTPVYERSPSAGESSLPEIDIPDSEIPF